MQFRLLGPLEVVDDSDRPLALGGRKQRSVLAVLLLHANDVVATERLVDEVWGDAPPATVAKSIQVYISRMRKELGDGRLVTRPPGYALHVEPSELDLACFQALVAQAADADPATAAARLREALGLWRGPALADLAYEPFAQAHAAQIEELRFSALEQRLDADLATGEHAQLIGELEVLAAQHPLRERLRGQLMLALYRSGRQADALEAYQAARTTLVEELGIEPGRALREMHQAILGQDEELDLAAPAEVPERASGRGVFVGRTRELSALDDALADALGGRGRILLIAGEPGIGKSRLTDELAVRARARGSTAPTSSTCSTRPPRSGPSSTCRARPDGLRFAHALIRDTLYDDLAPTRRLRMHARAGAALEAVYAADLESHLAELARHYVAAAPAGFAETAIAYARRAGDRAVGQLAFEEAERHYETALALAGDAVTRCELLLALGEARARAGDRERAKEAMYEAASWPSATDCASSWAAPRSATGAGSSGTSRGTMRASCRCSSGPWRRWTRPTAPRRLGSSVRTKPSSRSSRGASRRPRGWWRARAVWGSGRRAGTRPSPIASSSTRCVARSRASSADRPPSSRPTRSSAACRRTCSRSSARTTRLAPRSKRSLGAAAPRCPSTRSGS
jgi:DNA-binding SARP family transcriptional activator